MFSFHRLRGTGLLDTLRNSTVPGGKNRRMCGDNVHAEGGKFAYILHLVLGCWVLGVIIFFSLLAR